MKTSLLVPTLAFALAVTAPACAQTIGNAQSNQGHPDNSQDQNHDQNVLTIRKLKQDLEQAGFSDVRSAGLLCGSGERQERQSNDHELKP